MSKIGWKSNQNLSDRLLPSSFGSLVKTLEENIFTYILSFDKSSILIKETQNLEKTSDLSSTDLTIVKNRRLRFKTGEVPIFIPQSVCGDCHFICRCPSSWIPLVQTAGYQDIGILPPNYANVTVTLKTNFKRYGDINVVKWHILSSRHYIRRHFILEPSIIIS